MARVAARRAREAAEEARQTARREIEREEAIEIQQNPFNGVHPMVRCDLCGVLPICGIRQKCDICPDFDVCGDCFEIAIQSGPGSHEHCCQDFTKMRREAPNLLRANTSSGGYRTYQGGGTTRGASTRGGDSDEEDTSDSESVSGEGKLAESCSGVKGGDTSLPASKSSNAEALDTVFKGMNMTSTTPRRECAVCMERRERGESTRRHDNTPHDMTQNNTTQHDTTRYDTTRRATTHAP